MIWQITNQSLQHIFDFYDLGFKQRRILVGQETHPLKSFSLSTRVGTWKEPP
jgi:hypothetical protein